MRSTSVAKGAKRATVSKGDSALCEEHQCWTRSKNSFIIDKENSFCARIISDASGAKKKAKMSKGMQRATVWNEVSAKRVFERFNNFIFEKKI